MLKTNIKTFAESLKNAPRRGNKSLHIRVPKFVEAKKVRLSIHECSNWPQLGKGCMKQSSTRSHQALRVHFQLKLSIQPEQEERTGWISYQTTMFCSLQDLYHVAPPDTLWYRQSRYGEPRNRCSHRFNHKYCKINIKKKLFVPKITRKFILSRNVRTPGTLQMALMQKTTNAKQHTYCTSEAEKLYSTKWANSLQHQIVMSKSTRRLRHCLQEKRKFFSTEQNVKKSLVNKVP